MLVILALAFAPSQVSAQVSFADLPPAAQASLRALEVQAESARTDHVSNLPGSSFFDPSLLRLPGSSIVSVITLTDVQQQRLDAIFLQLEQSLLQFRGEAILNLGDKDGAIFTVQGIQRVLQNGINGTPPTTSGLIPVTSLTPEQQGVLVASFSNLAQILGTFQTSATALVGARNARVLTVQSVNQTLTAGTARPIVTGRQASRAGAEVPSVRAVAARTMATAAAAQALRTQQSMLAQRNLQMQQNLQAQQNLRMQKNRQVPIANQRAAEQMEEQVRLSILDRYNGRAAGAGMTIPGMAGKWWSAGTSGVGGFSGAGSMGGGGGHGMGGHH
jgi:uncharacterized membrane protein YgcG